MSALPELILRRVFELLDARSLVYCERVCRRFRQLVLDDLERLDKLQMGNESLTLASDCNRPDSYTIFCNYPILPFHPDAADARPRPTKSAASLTVDEVVGSLKHVGALAAIKLEVPRGESGRSAPSDALLDALGSLWLRPKRVVVDVDDASRLSADAVLQFLRLMPVDDVELRFERASDLVRVVDTRVLAECARTQRVVVAARNSDLADDSPHLALSMRAVLPRLASQADLNLYKCTFAGWFTVTPDDVALQDVAWFVRERQTAREGQSERSVVTVPVVEPCAAIIKALSSSGVTGRLTDITRSDGMRRIALRDGPFHLDIALVYPTIPSLILCYFGRP